MLTQINNNRKVFAMTTQTQFFETRGQHSPDGSPPNPPKPRLFYYDGQLFEDPGPEYTARDILNFLSATYPELRQGSWTSRRLSDGSEEITFHKVTGEKGAAVCAVPPSLRAVNWADRSVLGGGGYAVVYRINDFALKVGRIEPDEVEAQRHFATQGLALPVLSYQPELDLPEAVSRELCPRHGLRQEILPLDQPCSCDEAQAALLMPVADCDLAGVAPDEIRAFIAGFARACETQLGRFWDTRPSNVACYQGRLVALDFGATS
jgi:PRTRC genetic system protein C